MKDIRYEIISEIYKILSIARSKDFLEASKLVNVPENIKVALKALADETPIKNNRTTEEDQKIKLKELKTLDSESLNNKYVNKRFEDLIFSILSDKVKFASKKDVVQFANSISIPLSADSKDSRIRVVKRLTKRIVSSPKNIKVKALEILTEGLDKQTFGWFKLIRNSS